MEHLCQSSCSRCKWPLAIAVTLTAAWWGYRWLHPAYTPPLQPISNAYAELVTLGGQVATRTSFDGEMSPEELAAIVSANTRVLAKARTALRKESVVALDWNADRHWYGNVHQPRFAHLKQLARGFAAEGLKARREGNSRLAIQCGMDQLDLGQATSRGGLGTDWVTGMAIYRLGLASLRDSCDLATPEECQVVLKNLPVVSDSFDLPADITEREWHFWRRINGRYQTFRTELTFSDNRQSFEHELEETVLRHQASTDLLRLHYAIRLYRLEYDELPPTLERLLGNYLAVLPQDPFSERDYVYLPGGDRYILYSVGPNRIDDGGLVTDQDRSQGDLVLEPYAPQASEPLN